MRLTTFEQSSIIKHFKNIFPNAKLYLFGSRTDDSKKGGDIDLYIETKSSDYSYAKLLNFNASIQAEIGEQKIDIVVNKIDKYVDKLIYKNAKKQGILLGWVELKLQNAISEEEKHFKRFFSACTKLENSFPFDEKTLEDDDTVEHLDQMTWRFVKIQDSMGRRFIPYIIEYAYDTTDGLNFRDMLNKLEKLNILTSKEWNEFRILRNDITHIYPDEEKLLEALNEIYKRKDDLFQIYDNLKKYIEV